MAEVVANIYLLARKYSGIKRITAAHELAIAESTLKNYELGIAPVQDEMALKMSKLYHTPWLRVQHLEKNPVFCDVFGIMIDHANLMPLMNTAFAPEHCKETAEAMPAVHSTEVCGQYKRSLAVFMLHSLHYSVVSFS